jgi:penicillin amidase
MAGLGKFSSPAQNVVFADTAGHIGYYPTGRVPKRSRGNGELPQPADKDEDLWQGFYPETDKPYLIDPEKGFIVTANNPVLPARGQPIFSRTGIPSFRADRIAELITSQATLDMQDMREFQTDCLLPAARFLVGKIKDFSYSTPGPGFILEQLKKWNFKADRGICPFLFYRLEYHLSRQIFTDHLKNGDDRGLISINWLYRILDYPLGNLDTPMFASFIDDIATPQPEDFKEIVGRALTATYEDYRAQTAKGKADWEKLHIVEYRHPLGSVAFLKPLFNRGPYYMPGGRGSILTGSFSGSQDFRITHLSTFRLILDFSDFKNSLLVNSTGQSGHLLSRHYDDQITLYTRLAYRPLEQLPPHPRQLRLMPGKPSEK